ncbi:hypothetical protein CMUS01_05036 [Colletotrichum musicola]|uniref:Uncharacterized protein n=1 Tax=Colletotrichum musicola TaxID=2175873 RepID=A0A8H6NLU9_9PEZI|nr:hypothetical protein CMUS01_05036 [Colletotrichum musicola]
MMRARARAKSQIHPEHEAGNGRSDGTGAFNSRRPMCTPCLELPILPLIPPMMRGEPRFQWKANREGWGVRSLSGIWHRTAVFGGALEGSFSGGIAPCEIIHPPPANGLSSRTSPLAAFLFSSQNHTTASQSQNRLTIAQRLRVFGPGSVLPCLGHEVQIHAKSPAGDGFACPAPTLRSLRVALEPALHSRLARCQSSFTTVFKTGLASRRPGVGWTVASSEVTSRALACTARRCRICPARTADVKIRTLLYHGQQHDIIIGLPGLAWTGPVRSGLVWSGLKTTDLVGELPTKELGVDESEDEWTTYSG